MPTRSVIDIFHLLKSLEFVKKNRSITASSSRSPGKRFNSSGFSESNDREEQGIVKEMKEGNKQLLLTWQSDGRDKVLKDNISREKEGTFKELEVLNRKFGGEIMQQTGSEGEGVGEKCDELQDKDSWSKNGLLRKGVNMRNLEGVVQDIAVEGERGLEDCDLMWIDSSMKGNSKGSELTEVKVETEGLKNIKTGRQQLAGKYKASKGWRRLIQEIGKRKPLSEQNTGVDLQKRITKRKQAGNARKENDEELEGGQKRGELMAMEFEEITMLKVVEPNLNGAPRS